MIKQVIEEEKKENENDVAKNATIMLCNILYDKKVLFFYAIYL